MPQGSDKKSCFSIQKFACVHEYFPVYTSVHFPDHEMEQLCMHTVTRKFYLKSVLFSSQCVCPISNINIYFLLIRSRGRYSGGQILTISSVMALYWKVSWKQAPFFKCHRKTLQNIRICDSYKSINILYLKVEFNYMCNCDQ